MRAASGRTRTVTRACRSARPAFSILEVILARAILAGAIAVLGEASRIGLENARIARDMTYAQLLCESKLAEITSAPEPPTPEEGIPFGTVEDPSEPDWLYSVEVTPIDTEGLLEIRVTVIKDLPQQQRPVEMSLIGWMIDPEVAVMLKEEVESDELGSLGL
jgi:general secretion pathway protein I